MKAGAKAYPLQRYLERHCPRPAKAGADYFHRLTSISLESCSGIASTFFGVNFLRVNLLDGLVGLFGTPHRAGPQPNS